MTAMPSEIEHAIVEPEAMTQARPTKIERHGGDEEGVEKFRAQVLVTLRFMHSQRVPSTGLAESHESHDAAAQRSDAGQVDVATAGEGEPDQRIRAELLRHRRIHADPFAGCEPMGVSDVIRDGACGAETPGARNRAAAKQHVYAE